MCNEGLCPSEWWDSHAYLKKNRCHQNFPTFSFSSAKLNNSCGKNGLFTRLAHTLQVENFSTWWSRFIVHSLNAPPKILFVAWKSIAMEYFRDIVLYRIELVSPALLLLLDFISCMTEYGKCGIPVFRITNTENQVSTCNVVFRLTIEVRLIENLLLVILFFRESNQSGLSLSWTRIDLHVNTPRSEPS